MNSTKTNRLNDRFVSRVLHLRLFCLLSPFQISHSKTCQVRFGQIHVEAGRILMIEILYKLWSSKCMVHLVILYI